MTISKAHSLFSGLCLFFLAACSEPAVFMDFTAIPSSGWETGAISFLVPITDTAATYALGLDVRLSRTYTSRNLTLILHAAPQATAPPAENFSQTDTLHLDLSLFHCAKASGPWVDYRFPSLNRRFPCAGNWIFTFSPTAATHIKGIGGVGINLTRHEQR